MATRESARAGNSSLHLYRCDWPNGDVSFVLAEDPDDAIFELDEVGSAEEHMLTEVETFQVHFALTRKSARKRPRDEVPQWAFMLEGFGELTGEYMDLDAAVKRKRQLKGQGRSVLQPDTISSVHRSEQSHELPRRDKPFVQMTDIELRNAWDEMERGPSSLLAGMLDDARTGASGATVRTSVVSLVLPSGEERFVYGCSEYGDGEGRGAAASCWRLCSSLDALAKGERLTRTLLETRLADLTTTRTDDPVADEEGHDWVGMDKEDIAKGKFELVRRSNDTWVERLVDARRVASRVLVSIGMLSMPGGIQRSFCEDVELGDNEGRAAVADNIRTARRVGQLRENESLARHMLEIELHSLRTLLKPDPLRVPGRRTR